MLFLFQCQLISIQHKFQNGTFFVDPKIDKTLIWKLFEVGFYSLNKFNLEFLHFRWKRSKRF